MNTVKNIGLIASLLTEHQLSQLEAGAMLHKRHSNIEFKVISIENNTLTIRAIQGKNGAEKYLSQKELADRTKELFQRFFPNNNIHAGAIPYEEHHISKIDRNWINKRMMDLRIKAKDIERESGLDKTTLSHWLKDTNPKPLSQIAKAFFYFYFLSKEKEIHQ